MRGDEFGQIVEYVTRDGVFNVSPEVFTLDSVPTLEAVKADYEKVATLGRAKTLDVQAVKTAAANVYHADVVNNEIVSSDPVVVVDRLLFVRSHPEWHAGATVTAGDVWFYEGNLYRVVQSHKVEANWTPITARALWTRYYESDEIPDWVQPTGTHDAWPLGARVMHLDRIWISQIPANTTVPGSDVRWWVLAEGQEPIPDPDVTPEWVSGEQLTYSAANPIYRMYQGVKYQLRQSPGANIWPPPTVAALWLAAP